MKKFILLFLFCFAAQAHAAVVNVEKSSDGWRLFVDGKPYFIKGVCFSVDRIGTDPGEFTAVDWSKADYNKDGINDVAYQSWVDANRNNIQDENEKTVGDFQLLAELGANTIRLYHHLSNEPEVTKIYARPNHLTHAPNKKLYRELYEKHGIMIMMGDCLGAYTLGSGADWETGTDYRSVRQQKNMIKSVEAMVMAHKDEPYILMWALGNENDYQHLTHTNAKIKPEAYAKFVNEVAKRIHELDPHHPVCLINGQATFFRDNHLLDALPDVDIMGFNDYRRAKFSTLFKEASLYDKPVFLSEFGTGHPPVKIKTGSFIMNEEKQAQMHTEMWLFIENHSAGRKAPGNSIGGFVFSWIDDWWQDGKPRLHNLNPHDPKWHHEWNGLISQGNGNTSPRIRQLRQAYFTYQELWKE
ncbi:MAG: hypothetical protein K8S27_11870 [Candidatus Omnitrophica bacterium]|nr:hypothetical protein [Candidatus Omnitrophota bacterium]